MTQQIAGGTPAGLHRPVVELHAVAGQDAGHSWQLAAGRYLLDPWGAVPVPLPAGESGEPHAILDVGPDTACTLRPVPGGPTVTVDAQPLTAPTLVTGELICTPGAAWRLTPWVERHRPVVVRGAVGTLLFRRPPRRAGPVADELVIDVTPSAHRRVGWLGRVGGTRHQSAATQQVVTAVAQQRREALRRLRLASPDLPELAARARLLAPTLWERRVPDPDFLRLAIGPGPGTWQPEVRGDPSRSAELAQLLEQVRRIEGVPVTVDLDAIVALGLVGAQDAVLALARSLVVQIITLHGPADVGLFVLTTREGRGRWSWLAAAPHAGGGRGGPSVAADAASAAQLVAPLLGRPAQGQRALFLVDDLSVLRDRLSPVRALLAGAGVPARAIVLAPSLEEVPRECGAVVIVGPYGTANVREPARGRVVDGILTAGIGEAGAAGVAQDLAVLVDPELTAELPPADPTPSWTPPPAPASDETASWARGGDALLGPALDRGGRLPVGSDTEAAGPVRARPASWQSLPPPPPPPSSGSNGHGSR